jgi:ADP-ribosylglycohydrolase
LYKCGVKSAGNGALMRIAPMLIPHIETGGAGIWIDTALSAMLTHNDSGSIAGCVSFVNMLWQLLQMDIPPEPLWWLDEYVKVAQQLERDFSYQPRFGRYTDSYTGSIWQFVDTKVRETFYQNVPALDACNSWGSGAYLLETIPSVIYILIKHGNNLEEAIVRAVNDTKDNDTVAAIVGAAVGALHGKEKIPKQWLNNLSGRTTYDDNGKIFELLAKAKQLWWD